MSDNVYEEEYKGYKIEIFIDDSPESPREWDNAGTIVCWHSRYDLGDERPQVPPMEWFENISQDAIILPVFLYDHSGITISTHGDRYPYNDQWDAGQVGWVYITKKDAVKEWGKKKFTEEIRKKALECLENEVDTYDDYLTHNVFAYSVSKDGETVDSCFGYYPDHDSVTPYSYCLNDARVSVDFMIKSK